MVKLMVSIGDENFRLLTIEARDRGITIQELIRAVILPDWIRVAIGVPNRIHRDEALFSQPQNAITRQTLEKEEEVPPIFARHRQGLSRR